MKQQQQQQRASSPRIFASGRSNGGTPFGCDADESTGLLRPVPSTADGGAEYIAMTRRRSSCGSASRQYLDASTSSEVVDGRLVTKVRRTSSTSLRAGPAATGAWKLKYQDFVPDLSGVTSSVDSPWETTESFSKIVARASKWLKNNPDVQVKTCQTITWMSHDRQSLVAGNCSELMVLSRCLSEGSSTYYVRGLRLWLVPSTSSNSSPGSLGPTSRFGAGTLRSMDVTPDRTTTTTVHELVSVVNDQIEEQQLCGQLLTVETVSVPIIDGVLEAGVTRWREPVSEDSPNAFILRVYYLDASAFGGPAIGKIGIKDVIPQLIDDGGYEGFEDLCERANVWLKEQSDCVVLNMQSIMAIKDEDMPQSDIGLSCFFSSPGINAERPIDFFRILRIAFTKSSGISSSRFPTGGRNVAGGGGGGPGVVERRPSAAAAYLDSAPTKRFAYETFTPELVRRNVEHVRDRLETMNETFSKVMAFMQNSGPIEVLSAEVVFNPMQLYVNIDDCMSNVPDEVNFLYTIRVFIVGRSSRLDGSLRSVRRASNLSICRAGGGNDDDEFETDLVGLRRPCSNGAARAYGLASGPSLSGRAGGGTSQGGRNGSTQLADPEASMGEDVHPGPIFLRHVVSRRFPYRWLILAVSAISCMTIIVVVSVVYSNR